MESESERWNVTSRLREQCAKVVKKQSAPGELEIPQARAQDSNTFTKNMNMTHRNFIFGRYSGVRLPMLDNRVFSFHKASAVLVANKSGNLDAKIILEFKLW